MTYRVLIELVAPNPDYTPPGMRTCVPGLEHVTYNADGSVANITRDVIDITCHVSDPNIVTYRPTAVVCDECGWSGDHGLLESDSWSEDDYSNSLCPNCGADACDVEYETIAEYRARATGGKP